MRTNNKSRVQINELPKESLQPTARIVDTYHRPSVSTDTGSSNLAALAKSLSALKPGITSYADDLHAKHVERMEGLAQGRIDGLTFEEAQKLRKSGELSLEDDPWYDKALEQQYGLKYARNRTDDLITRASGVSTSDTENNAFDPATVDIDSMLADISGSDIEELGDGSVAGNAYLKAMNATRSKLVSLATTERVAKKREYALGSVNDNFMAEIEVGLAANMSADEIVKRVRGHYETNKSLLGVEFKDQDAEIVSIAGVLAEQGEYDLVEALLLGDRDGIPPLGGSRKYAAVTEELLDTARKESLKTLDDEVSNRLLELKDRINSGAATDEEIRQMHSDHPDMYTQADMRKGVLAARNNHRKLLRSNEKNRLKHQKELTAYRAEAKLDAGLLALADEGELYGAKMAPVTLPTKTGGTKELSPSELRERVAETYTYKTSGKLAATRGENPEQTFAREVEWFSNNALVNPQWKEALSAGWASANYAGIQPGEVPPALKQSIQLYERLHAASPGLLKHHLKDGSAYDFYEAYRVGKQMARMDTDQALSAALEVTRDPTGFKAKMNGARYDQLGIALHEVLTSPSSGILNWGDDIENVGNMAIGLERLGKFYVQMGLSAEDSLTEAATRLKEDFVVVNGWAVPSDITTPPDFPEMATAILKEFAAESSLDPEDITLRPLGNASGAWGVVLKSTGMLIPSKDNKLATFTLDTIMARRNEIRARSDKKAAERASKKKADIIKNQKARQRATEINKSVNPDDLIF